MITIDVKFEETQPFIVGFDGGEEFNVDFGEVTTLVDPDLIEKYMGDYEVTPKLSEQTLETKSKMMINDVTVKSVPVYKTKNASGGYTVYIASEVNE